MIAFGWVFTGLAVFFVFVAVMAGANDFKEDAKIMGLVAITCAILGSGFLNVS